MEENKFYWHLINKYVYFHHGSSFLTFIATKGFAVRW
jgi:hypothetical protein